MKKLKGWPGVATARPIARVDVHLGSSEEPPTDVSEKCAISTGECAYLHGSSVCAGYLHVKSDTILPLSKTVSLEPSISRECPHRWIPAVVPVLAPIPSLRRCRQDDSQSLDFSYR